MNHSPGRDVTNAHPIHIARRVAAGGSSPKFIGGECNSSHHQAMAASATIYVLPRFVRKMASSKPSSWIPPNTLRLGSSGTPSALIRPARFRAPSLRLSCCRRGLASASKWKPLSHRHEARPDRRGECGSILDDLLAAAGLNRSTQTLPRSLMCIWRLILRWNSRINLTAIRDPERDSAPSLRRIDRLRPAFA